jgi:hypothetical protein
MTHKMIVKGDKRVRKIIYVQVRQEIIGKHERSVKTTLVINMAC